MRLLLVEDERPLASALDDALREDGWVVDLATDGREGLVGSSRVDLQACKLEYSIVSPK